MKDIKTDCTHCGVANLCREAERRAHEEWRKVIELELQLRRHGIRPCTQVDMAVVLHHDFTGGVGRATTGTNDVPGKDGGKCADEEKTARILTFHEF